MNRQPAAHPDPYDEAPSAARQRGNRRAERKTRKRRNVPPARTWTDVADMPQFGITLPEAAQYSWSASGSNRTSNRRSLIGIRTSYLAPRYSNIGTLLQALNPFL